jgi:hypothetical protein
MTEEYLRHRLELLDLQGQLLEKLLLDLMADFEAMRELLLSDTQRKQWEAQKMAAEQRVKVSRDCLARNVLAEREKASPK